MQPAYPEMLGRYDRLWKLAEIALRDLAACEADSHYSIYMGQWHKLVENFDGKGAVCEVCLAGSVMAKTCRLPEAIQVDVYRDGNRPIDDAVRGGVVDGWRRDVVKSFHVNDNRKFMALDKLRQGMLQGALRDFYGAMTDDKLPKFQGSWCNPSNNWLVKGILKSSLGMAVLGRYEEAPEAFKDAMRGVIQRLKEADL